MKATLGWDEAIEIQGVLGERLVASQHCVYPWSEKRVDNGLSLCTQQLAGKSDKISQLAGMQYSRPLAYLVTSSALIIILSHT